MIWLACCHAEVESRIRPGRSDDDRPTVYAGNRWILGLSYEWSTQRSRPGTVEWLLDAVERHAIAEQDALAQYEYLRTASGDPVIALVMQLILDDEERHHGLLKRIEATLRDAVEWTHSPTALPASVPPQQPVPAELVETARL